MLPTTSVKPMHKEPSLPTQPPSRKTSGGTDGVLSSMDQDSRIEVQGRRIKPPERPLVLQMVGYRPALMRIKTQGLRVRCLGQIPKKSFLYFPKDQGTRIKPPERHLMEQVMGYILLHGTGHK